MRFVIVLVLILACVACVGFYRGWFRLTSDTGADKSNVTLTVDKEKLEADKQKVLEKAQGAGHPAKDQPVTPAGPATNQD